jgi:hypothetical protein
MARRLSRRRAHVVAPIAGFELPQEGSPLRGDCVACVQRGVVRVCVVGSMCSTNAHADQEVVPGKRRGKC